MYPICFVTRGDKLDVLRQMLVVFGLAVCFASQAQSWV